jgi:Cdc6-like AAA superfamily ATPase
MDTLNLRDQRKRREAQSSIEEFQIVRPKYTATEIKKIVEVLAETYNLRTMVNK